MDSPSRYDVLAVSVALDVKSPPSATGEVERSANGDVPTPAHVPPAILPEQSSHDQPSSQLEAGADEAKAPLQFGVSKKLSGPASLGLVHDAPVIAGSGLNVAVRQV